MWVYYYVSKARVSQLAEQIFIKLPVEIIKRWDLNGAAKISAEGETSKLLEFIGLKGKASTGIEGGAKFSSQDKFDFSDKVFVDKLKEYLEKSKDYSELSTNSTHISIKNIKGILKFSGNFSPLIKKEKGIEPYALYIEKNYLIWKGICGEIPVHFVTSKESFVSSTPIFSFLDSEIKSLFIDGFATLLQTNQSLPLCILPLFFGREVTN